MKTIYLFVAAVAVVSQVEITLAHEPKPAKGKRLFGAVNREFRRTYNVNTDSVPSNFTKSQSPRHKICETPQVCKAPTLPELESYTDFMFQFSKYTELQSEPHEKMENDCNCLDKKFRQELGPRFLKEVGSERKKLNEKILKAASKKFLNDYASNIEDASFFLLKTSGVFKDPEAATEIQCNDSKKFNDMIQATCGADVSREPAKYEDKKLALLNSLGGESRPGMNFDQRIRDISRQIQFLPIPGVKDKDGKGLKYSRSVYDRSRIGLSRLAEGRFVEHLVEKLILHPEFENQIQSGLVNKTPLEAVMDIIEANMGDGAFLEKIGADKNITGDVLPSMNEIREDFKFLMQTHPGFLNTMRDSQSVKLLINSVKRDSKISLLEHLETNPDILGPLLSSRCVDLTKQFADVVCTKDEDLIKSVEASDLEELNHPAAEINTDSEPELHELLMCQESGKDVKAAFGRLADLENENNFTTRRSDYLERLLEPDIEKHKNLFSVTMLKSSRDRRFRKEMNRYAQAGQDLSRSVSSRGVIAHDVYVESVAEGSDFSLGKSTISRAEAKDYMKSLINESKNVESVRMADVTSRRESETSGAHTKEEVMETRRVDRKIASEGPMTSYSAGTMRTEDDVNRPNDQRQVLSRDLSRSNPVPEVQRHISKLDDQTISEIANLRNMNSNLMSQMIADEEKKLQEFRDRLSGVNNTLVPPVQEVQEIPEIVGPENSIVTPSAVPERTITESVSRPSGAALKGASAAASVGPSSGEEEIVSTITPERRGGGDAIQTSDTPSTQGLSLTVISNQRPQNNDLSPEVIENEVSNYLEGKELRPSEFEDLMRNGLKYRYQVVVNDVVVIKEKIIPFNSLPERTRRELETKYARDRLEMQTSKLAVLRMLMRPKPL